MEVPVQNASGMLRRQLGLEEGGSEGKTGLGVATGTQDIPHALSS